MQSQTLDLVRQSQIKERKEGKEGESEKDKESPIKEIETEPSLYKTVRGKEGK